MIESYLRLGGEGCGGVSARVSARVGAAIDGARRRCRWRASGVLNGEVSEEGSCWGISEDMYSMCRGACTAAKQKAVH